MYIPTTFFGAGGALVATGGDISTFVSESVLYKSHYFTTNGTFQVLNGSSQNTQIMLIGGGGGTAGAITFPDNLLDRWYGGTGGSGQLVQSSSLDIFKQSYNISIGSAGNSPISATGGDGGDTIISSSNLLLTAKGGGGGGYKGENGRNGGSGGGAGPRASFNANTLPGQDIYGPFGNDGGEEFYTKESNTGYYYYGGGGGGTAGPAAINGGGAPAKTSNLRYGTEVPFGFGFPNVYKLPRPLPTGYYNTPGNSFTNGAVIITYPLNNVPVSNCYSYRLTNCVGYKIRYTNCEDNVIDLLVGDENVDICRKKDTPIYRLDETAGATLEQSLLPTQTLTYLSPCAYATHDVFFGNDSSSACNSSTETTIYSTVQDTILNTGSVVYYDNLLNNPVTQSYFSDSVFSLSKKWYYVSGNDGVITDLGICFETGSELTTGSVINITDINTGSFYNTQFVGPTSLQNIQNTGVTLEIWAKNPALTRNYDAFIGLWDGQSIPNRDWIEIRQDGLAATINHVLGDIYSEESPTFEDKTSPSSAVPNSNNWYHHILTFDVNTNVAKYYRNGSLEGTVSSSLDPNIFYQTVHVGQQEDGPICNMYVGEYRVYTSSLDLVEIITNFAKTKTRYGY